MPGVPDQHPQFLVGLVDWVINPDGTPKLWVDITDYQVAYQLIWAFTAWLTWWCNRKVAPLGEGTPSLGCFHEAATYANGRPVANQHSQDEITVAWNIMAPVHKEIAAHDLAQQDKALAAAATRKKRGVYFGYLRRWNDALGAVLPRLEAVHIEGHYTNPPDPADGGNVPQTRYSGCRDRARKRV